MIIARPSFPSGHTIFCDDVRTEINNKITLVGVYPGQMVVFAQPPAILSQLSAYIVLRLAATEVPTSLVAKLVFTGVSGIETVLWEKSFTPSQPDPQSFDNFGPDAHPHVEWRAVAQLTGIHFAEHGYIKCRVYYADTEVRLGVLTVSFQPAEAAADK